MSFFSVVQFESVAFAMSDHLPLLFLHNKIVCNFVSKMATEKAPPLRPFCHVPLYGFQAMGRVKPVLVFNYMSQYLQLVYKQLFAELTVPSLESLTVFLCGSSYNVCVLQVRNFYLVLLV